MTQTVRRHSLLLGILLAGALLPAQDIQHVRTAINIEVPVRVFKGEAFVDGLTLADFEVYEDGRLQSLDAVYLVRKTLIERREETTPFAPDTSRHFYLFFEMTEYDARLRDALGYFVDEVLLPGDELFIVTPMKTYRMKSELFTAAGRERVFEQLLGLLRRDILIGSAEYRDALDDMKSLALTMAGAVGLSAANAQSPMAADMFAPATVFDVSTSVEEQLQTYTTLLNRLEAMRQVDQVQIAAFADRLRGQAGRKEIFLFYQREFIPKLDDMILTTYQSTFNDRPDIVQTVTGLFEFFKRETTLDVEPIRRAYADSGAAVHFLFLTRTAPKVPGVVMEEQSEDIFAPFREMSRATGGYMASTSNLKAAMESAVAAAENYYLLYYTPKDYVADGRFHRLEVRLKSGSARISHRLGYIAD
jgi:VWFA-related protein